MTDEFDYIAYARERLATLTPEGRGWGSYPANVDDWNGTAQAVTDTFCGGENACPPDETHKCARDLVRVGFEDCEDCYFPAEYAQLLAAVPDTFRALLAEIDRQAAILALVTETVKDTDGDWIDGESFDGLAGEVQAALNDSRYTKPQSQDSSQGVEERG